jgi:Uma2 family endonuclease
MTLGEFARLPEDTSRRYELQEGVLLVTPRPIRSHQLAAQRLAQQFDAQLPREWESVLEMEVMVRGGDLPIVRVPDLVVTRVGGPEARLAASDVLLAVEIVSPGSRNLDSVLKPFEYARAGISHYWLIDLAAGEPTLAAFWQGPDGYSSGTALTGIATLDAPVPVRVDLPALVARRDRR